MLRGAYRRIGRELCTPVPRDEPILFIVTSICPNRSATLPFPYIQPAGLLELCTASGHRDLAGLVAFLWPLPLLSTSPGTLSAPEEGLKHSE